MSIINSAWFAIGLDMAMIIYTLWVISLGNTNRKMPLGIGAGMIAWLAALHFGLSTKTIFPADISGIAFLAIVFLGVGVVGALLFFIRPVREQLMALDQQQLMLMQGIRVFFGANFLMLASLGSLPKPFGILDGWTHIAAGFFGLIAASAIARGVDGERRTWFANFFGLADILIVASALSLLLLPTLTPYHPMMYAVFLPAPLWLWFHLTSIWKLTQASRYCGVRS
jgi:hypothetical protein